MTRYSQAFDTITEMSEWTAGMSADGTFLSLGKARCQMSIDGYTSEKGVEVYICNTTEPIAAFGKLDRDSWMCFSMCSQASFQHGIFMKPGELFGFNQPRYAGVFVAGHAIWSINIDSSAIYRFGRAEVLAVIKSCNSIELTPEQQEEFKGFCTDISQGTNVTTATVAAFICGLFLPEQATDTNEQVKGWDMGCKLIKIAHSQVPEEKIKLPDLSRMLLSNKNKITETAKGLFGVTPMEILRKARLQQCRIALARRTYKTVEETRLSYGFSNRADFNNRYKREFGESPARGTKSL